MDQIIADLSPLKEKWEVFDKKNKKAREDTKTMIF